MGIIARQSIKASIAGFVGVGIGAISRLFLYTKFLSASEIGILETIMKLGLILTPFFIIGAPQVIKRFYNRFENDKDDSGLIFTYSFLLFLILIPISSILYVFLHDYIFAYYTSAPELKHYFILPLIVAITYGGFNYFKSIAIVHLRITVPAILNGVLDRILILILLILYGVFHVFNINQFFYLNIFLFYCVPFFLIIMYLIIVIKPKVKKTTLKESLKVLKTTSSYNSYLVFGSLSGVIISAIDVNMIAGSLGTQFAGIYTIAFFMGNVIDIPRRNLNNILYPILNKSIIENNISKIEQLYQKSSVNQFLVGSFIFLVVWLNIDEIFKIIPNGEIFATGKLVMLFIGLSKVFDMLMGVNKQIIELSKYYKFNLLNDVFLSVLIIVLNLYFIKLDSSIFGGINGVAFASLLALTISNLLSFIIVLAKEKIHPITFAHFKILVLILLIYAAIYFISISNPFISIIIKTFIVSVMFILLSLLFNVSEDFKFLFKQATKKLFP